MVGQTVWVLRNEKVWLTASTKGNKKNLCAHVCGREYFLVGCVHKRRRYKGNLVNSLVCLSISRFLSVISPSCYQKAFWYFDFLIFLCGICSVFVSFYMCTECVFLQKYSCFCSNTFLLYRFANLKLCILWINAFRVGLSIFKIRKYSPNTYGS